MSYLKKIISYLDYYEYGYKKKNAGYVKVWIQNEKVTLDIQIKGLPIQDSCFCDIQIYGTDISLGRFLLDRGTGYFNACYPAVNLDGTGLAVFDVNGLRLSVEADRFCVAQWEWEEGDVPEEFLKRRTTAAETSEASRQTDSFATVMVKKEERPEAGTVREKLQGTKAAREECKPGAPLSVAEKGSKRQDWENVYEQMGVPVQERVHDDKWRQLCTIYPVCYPFGKEEMYLSIAPKDFVILRREYQGLVNNSFLLHGFYNYHHIILGKKWEEGAEAYYLGVPGTYYEREKMVAVMFGFEGFEASRQNKEDYDKNQALMQKIGVGAFGYYMRKVDI